MEETPERSSRCLQVDLASEWGSLFSQYLIPIAHCLCLFLLLLHLLHFVYKKMFAYPIHFDWLLIYATGAQAASTVNALSTRALTRSLGHQLVHQIKWPQCTLKQLIKWPLKGTLILEALFCEANKQLHLWTHSLMLLLSCLITQLMINIYQLDRFYLS